MKKHVFLNMVLLYFVVFLNLVMGVMCQSRGSCEQKAHYRRRSKCASVLLVGV